MTDEPIPSSAVPTTRPAAWTVRESPEPDGGPPAGRPGTGPPAGRTVDARLARLHLRGGLISLARAELETMAGAGTLDREALADLAEARWRSGDLIGGGEAAKAHLDAGGSEPLAMVVAVESLAAEGRLAESRQLATRVAEQTPGLIERMFAGQPRSHSWTGLDAPSDREPDGPSAWGSLSGGREVVAPARRVRRAIADRTPEAGTGQPIDTARVAPRASGTLTGQQRDPRDPPVVQGATPWSAPGHDAAAEARTAGEDLPTSDQPDGSELGAIEDAIGRGDVGSVAARLGLVLRADRALAPVVLSLAERAVGPLEQHHPDVAALHLVIGDAYRILGREADAAVAFQRSRLALDTGPHDDEEPS